MAIDKQCNVTWRDYLKLLLDLLPPGYAWEWNESSVGRHLLAAFADELVRFHLFLCQIVEFGIDQFKTEKYGWSSPAYEKLLLDKFGINTEVSDWQMDPLNVDNANCESFIWNQRFTYFVIITVPDIAVIPTEVKTYLNQYKQSHTAICWRSKPKVQELWDIDPLTVDNAHAESDIYTKHFHAIEISHHPSYEMHELVNLTLPTFKKFTVFIKEATRIGNAKASSELIGNDVAEHVQTKLFYKLEPLCTL